MNKCRDHRLNNIGGILNISFLDSKCHLRTLFLFPQNNRVRVQYRPQSGVDKHSSLVIAGPHHHFQPLQTHLISTDQAMSSSTARLDRYKLESKLTDTSVTHRTIQSDLSSGSRRTEVMTTWVHDRKLGAGAFGEVSLQREILSGQLRAVKVVPQHQVRVHEMDALIDLQDVSRSLSECTGDLFGAE